TIPTTKSMTAEATPPAIKLVSAGTAQFILLVHNTGNTEDGYTAVITNTSGPVVGALNNVTGQAAQNIPVFRLPVLSSGEIRLCATLTAPGSGSVSVQITSLTDPTITASVVAVVQSFGSLTATLTTRTTAIGGVAAPGTSVSDTATLAASSGGPTPGGTVTFFLCSA